MTGAILLSAAQAALLYAAFGLRSEGAMNVLAFLVVSLALVSPLMLAGPTIQDAAKLPRRPMVRALRWSVSWAVLIAVVWHAHWGLVCAQAFAMVITAIAQKMVDKARDSTR